MENARSAIIGGATFGAIIGGVVAMFQGSWTPILWGVGIGIGLGLLAEIMAAIGGGVRS